VEHDSSHRNREDTTQQGFNIHYFSLLEYVWWYLLSGSAAAAPHVTLQHSVGQLPSRLLDDLVDFLQLFLHLRRLVLGVFLLSENERDAST